MNEEIHSDDEISLNESIRSLMCPRDLVSLVFITITAAAATAIALFDGTEAAAQRLLCM